MVGTGCLVYFNRIPNRVIPEYGVVSPTSGQVVSIETHQGNQFTFVKDGVENQMSIPMLPDQVSVIIVKLTPADVHVQRVPLDGRLIFSEHKDGLHRNALGSNPQKIFSENEKTISVFAGYGAVTDDDYSHNYGVVQVAGIAARRIDNWITDPGTEVVKGEPYGRILLGSQVVILVPADKPILVKPGDYLIDGETVITK
jgi:phosphatidylserine decarboxylase